MKPECYDATELPCLICKRNKPKSDFYIKKEGYHSSYCKTCDKAKAVHFLRKRTFAKMSLDTLYRKLESTDCLRAMLAEEIARREKVLAELEAKNAAV